MDALSEIDLRDLAKRNRMQTIVFKITSNVFDQMQPKWEGTKDSLLGQVIRIVEQVLRSDRIRSNAPGFDDDELKRRVLRILNMNRIVEHVFRAIKSENSTRLDPVFDSQKPIMSTGDMRPWYTSRPYEHAKRSHINQCVYDSTWEASESFELDRNGNVEA